MGILASKCPYYDLVDRCLSERKRMPDKDDPFTHHICEVCPIGTERARSEAERVLPPGKRFCDYQDCRLIISGTRRWCASHAYKGRMLTRKEKYGI